MGFLGRLLDTSDFPPRWYCGNWSEGLGWLHVLSDIGIWSAYFAIPVVLFYFLARRPDLPFRVMFALFGAFIILCGTTHLLEAVIFWWPVYRLAGLVKFVTAAVSWVTVLALFRVVPTVLAMRAPEELEREIAARTQAEEALKRANDELERRVADRTRDLSTAATKLREERKLLETTLASIGDGVIVTDAEGGLTFLNQVAEALTGWANRDARGLPLGGVFNVVNEETREPVGDPALRAIRDGAAAGQTNKLVLISKGGGERPIEETAAPIRDEDGNASGAVLVFRDATEGREYLRGLEERERLFHSLAESIPQLAWMANQDGHVFWYNRRWYDYTGTNLEQMEGWGWKSVHDPDVLPAVLEKWEGSIASGEPFDMVFPIRGADGAFRPFLTRVMPVKDEKGRVSRWFGTNTDVGEAKRQEEALRERERFVQRVLDASPGVVYLFDLPDWRTTFINQRSQTALGVSPDDVIAAGGRFWEDHVHPDDLPSLRDHVGRVAAADDDDLLSVEYRMRHADGRWLWFVSRDLVFVRGPDGKPRQVLGVATDVTENKRAEESLRYQLDLTKSITDNATTPIFMLDNRSRCTFMNPAAEAMIGHSFAEIDGQVLHDFVHHHYPDGRPYPVSECPITSALPTEVEVRGLEDVFFRKDGGAFPVVCNARVITKGGKGVGTVLEVRDVTAEKKAEAESVFLSETGDMLAGLQDLRSTLDKVARRSVPFLCEWCVIDLIGEDRQIQRIASAHADPRKESILDELVERYPSSWSSASLVVRVLTTGEPEVRPVVLESLVEEVSRDDEQARLIRLLAPRSFMAVPLKVRGRTLGAIGFVRGEAGPPYEPADLEVARELARRAAIAIDNSRLYENLREADRRKSEFLAILAHELRNPLAPILNGLRLTRLAGNDRETVVQAQAMMERQLNQLVRLVDDLMDISRISIGKIELRRERVDLKQVLESAIETSRSLIDEMEHELTVSVPEESAPLDADFTRLAQVFSNLLNNAAKYADRQGRIRLAAEHRGADVVVSVSDDGIGMAADQLTRVFEMFSQVDQSLVKSRGGLGIGLSLVKRLLDLHGGEIEARSEGPGKGSEFVVRLPMASETAPPPAAEQQEEEGEVPPRRVLIVDDNRDSADSLAMMLRMLGNETRTAYDGEEAVAAAAEFRPAVILLDIGLPKLSGHEACRQIRAQPWGGDMFIIAQTGWGQEEDRRRTQDAGFNYHLVKPIDPTLLLKVLSEVPPREIEREGP